MQVTIKRIEIDTDNKGRQVVHETRMLDLSGWTSSEVLETLIDEIYTNKNGEGIDFDSSTEGRRELEVFGDVVLQYLDKLEEADPTQQAKEKFNKTEDGVDRQGRTFDIKNMVYSIEIY